MSDKKRLTIVFAVTVVVLIICGGLIATAGFTDVNIPILSDLLNKKTTGEQVTVSSDTVSSDAVSDPSVLPADYDSGPVKDTSESARGDNQTEWGSCGPYDSFEDEDSYFGFGSRLEYIVNSYIVGKRLLSYNMFEHIPPEWIPGLGYQIPEGSVTLAELRAMSIDERVDFYKNLVNNSEFSGVDYNWAKVDYSFTVSDYDVIADRDHIDLIIRSLCGPSLPDDESSWQTSDFYNDFLSSNFVRIYCFNANVDIDGRQLLQVDEQIFYVFMTDNNFYIAPHFMNNVMHMLAVYQQQYTQ